MSILCSSIKLLHVVMLKIPEKSQLGSDLFFFKVFEVFGLLFVCLFLKEMLTFGGFILKHEMTLLRSRQEGN